jgi:CubicO group peptidase (beta-lactamase class C family)
MQIIHVQSSRRKSLLSILILLAVALPAHMLNGQTAQRANNAPIPIDSLLQREMTETGIVGMSAAIIIHNKVVWTKGYGYADRENKIPFTTSTIMNIASITKTFTGVCIMKAVEEGKLSLDEDINTYLPFKVVNPHFPHEKITLRHLATHTSGLCDRSPFYGDSTYYFGGKTPEPLGQFLKNYFVPGGQHYTTENFIKAKPGTYRDYCNIGAGLAGYIVELRTGEKLSEYGKKHIFKPLKMRNTGWSLATVNTQHHAKLYTKKGDSIKPVQWYEGTTYPDGGVRTSVDALAKFFCCLLNGGSYQGTRILKKQTVAEMLRFQFTAANKPENVKLDKLNSGIFWATKMGGTRIGHNGSDFGVRAFMLADLTKTIGVVFLVNTSLEEAAEGKFFDIYDRLYQYALSLKK